MDWDNSGLQTGRPDRPVRRVLIALDATSEVVDMAVREKADLILTHHPLIFKGVKRVTEDDFVGRRILTMAENRIACFAMHTNFDVLCMADAAADLLELSDRQVLEMTRQEWDQTEGIGRTVFSSQPALLRGSRSAGQKGLHTARFRRRRDRSGPGTGCGSDDHGRYQPPYGDRRPGAGDRSHRRRPLRTRKIVHSVYAKIS